MLWSTTGCSEVLGRVPCRTLTALRPRPSSRRRIVRERTEGRHLRHEPDGLRARHRTRRRWRPAQAHAGGYSNPGGKAPRSRGTSASSWRTSHSTCSAVQRRSRLKRGTPRSSTAPARQPRLMAAFAQIKAQIVETTPDDREKLQERLPSSPAALPWSCCRDCHYLRG